MSACVLCAARDRVRQVPDGHVCEHCLTRLADTLDTVALLVAGASTDLTSGRGSGRSVPGSRPPIDLDGVDPALTLVDLGHAKVPLLEVLESWERLVREERALAPYGPASAARAAAVRTGPAGYGHTTTLLVACAAFLRASLPWWATRPDLPVDHLADEVHACRRAVTALDPDRSRPAYGIPCPSMADNGEDCGWVIPVRRVDPDEHAACRRCGRIWDTDRLLAVAGREADAWVDPEAAAAYAGVTERTVRSWGARGLVRREHGRYSLADIRATRRPA